jgi:ribonucleoside-triphosphate reductase
MKELQKKNGGLFGSGDSTGSIGVCTINLPRIAHLTKDKDKFFEMLYKYMATAKDSLEIKRTFLQKEVLDGGMIPAFKEYVGTLKNHFCTIGYVGLNEAIENLTGKDIVEDKGLALEILNKMRDKIQEFQIETGHLYNLESSPAESTAFRLAKKDVDEFGYREIAVQGSATAPYYTNSCHIPVKKVKNVKQLLDHQNDLQVLHTGGTVVHIFTDGPISGQQAKSLIRNVCEKYHIPYVSHSPLNTICPTHGLLNPSSETCPECGAVTKKYQRITGYIRNVDHFNPGKLSEFKDRNQLCQESLKVD